MAQLTQIPSPPERSERARLIAMLAGDNDAVKPGLTKRPFIEVLEKHIPRVRVALENEGEMGGAHFSPIYITGMAVSSQSRSEEAAYLFAQWATNKTNAVHELMAGVGVRPTSTWDSPEVKAKPKMLGDWYQAYQASLKIGRQGLPEIVGVTEIIPGIAYLIPWYIFFRRLRMVDTYGALILTRLSVSLPIIIWVMISFFEDVPPELEDAALMDGSSYLGVFLKIALPLARPGVMATAILSFVFPWNNFLFSVILAGRETKQ